MASNLIVARGATVSVPPISLAFYRWLCAFLILVIFTGIGIYKKKKYFYEEFFPLFFLGITSAGICGAFPFIAGTTTSVINMGIIYSSSPVFIVLFSHYIFRRNFTPNQLIGLSLSLFGVLLITCKGSINVLTQLKFTLGDLWILGASISWALYSVYQVKFKTKFTLLERLTLISFFGAISLFPFLYVENNFFPPFILNYKSLFWILFAAISPSIIAFILYIKLQEKVGPSIAGLVVYLYPVYGSYFGYIIFKESLMHYHYFGALFVLIGIFLSNKTDFKRSK